MGASAAEGPSPDEKKGLGKYVARMKSILKKSDGSKRWSLSARPAAATTTTATTTTMIETTQTTGAAVTPPTPTAPVQAPTAAMATMEPNTVEPPTEPETGPPETPAPPPASTVPQPRRFLRSKIEAERSARLAKRFNLPPRDGASADGKEAYRIERPVRMRVHRTCHECSIIFGSNKTCVGCQHVHCVKCVRYPLRKSDKKERAVGFLTVDHSMNFEDEILLTKPSKLGGQPWVRKKTMQRVRRHCHECSTPFVEVSKTCANCSHVRCSDCPRDPPKKLKYPYGYPGDVPSARSRYFSCHQCTKVFPAVGEDGHAPECARCQHIKCKKCLHATPRKVDPEPDTEVLRRLEARLKEMRLGASATAA